MNILIPTPLRSFADGIDSLDAIAATIAKALDLLIDTYPGQRKHLFTEN